MMNQAAFSDVYLDLGRMGELRAAAAQESPEALEAVAKQFEGIFLKMVLKRRWMTVLPNSTAASLIMRWLSAVRCFRTS